MEVDYFLKICYFLYLFNYQGPIWSLLAFDILHFGIILYLWSIRLMILIKNCIPICLCLIFGNLLDSLSLFFHLYLVLLRKIDEFGNLRLLVLYLIFQKILFFFILEYICLVFVFFQSYLNIRYINFLFFFLILFINNKLTNTFQIAFKAIL